MGVNFTSPIQKTKKKHQAQPKTLKAGPGLSQNHSISTYKNPLKPFSTLFNT